MSEKTIEVPKKWFELLVDMARKVRASKEEHDLIVLFGYIESAKSFIDEKIK